MEDEGRSTQEPGESYARSGITGKIENSGLDKVFVPNQKFLQCFECNKKFVSNDVIYWCKSKVVFCKDCELNTNSCRYSKMGIWHEHIRGMMK